MDAINLKPIPKDVQKIILKTQGDIKVEKGVGVYSQTATIIYMIREYDKLLKKISNGQ